MSDEQRKGRRAIETGPTGRTVGKNLAMLRKRRDLTTRQLSAALERVGRPIPASGITRMEKGERAVTVDDLTALAVVLMVSPTALLLPPEDTGAVNVTPATAVPWKAAWRWAHGEEPPFSREKAGDDYEERRRRFLAECQPYRDRDHLAELAKYIRARIDGPWHVELDSNGETEHGTLSLRSMPSTALEDQTNAFEAVVKAAGVDPSNVRMRFYGPAAKQEQTQDTQEDEGR